MGSGLQTVSTTLMAAGGEALEGQADSPRLHTAALRLKFSGIPWQPEDGDFVWDPTTSLGEVGWAGRVFCLNDVGLAESRFSSPEEMRQSLVWLPTRTQLASLFGDSALCPDSRPPREPTRLADLYERATDLLIEKSPLRSHS